MTWIVRPESINFFALDHGEGVFDVRYGFQTAPAAFFLWIAALEGCGQYQFRWQNVSRRLLLPVFFLLSFLLHAEDIKYRIYRYGNSPNWKNTVTQFGELVHQNCPDSFNFPIFPDGWVARINSTLCKSYRN